MPEHLKHAQNTKEFDEYLKSFVKQRERQHRYKVLREIAASIALMTSE